MSDIFYGCSYLTNINLSNFNTQNVKYMIDIFKECDKLKKNNVITFDQKLLDEIQYKLKD